MTDVLAAIRAVLLADPDVVALCDVRVYACELPKAGVESMPRACVVVTYAGGMEKRGTDPIGKPRVDAYSYGATYRAAGQVDRAVYDALRAVQRQKVGEVLIHGVALSGGPIPMRDTEAGWPVFVRSMSVSADERAIEE
jgi:hypothetical protein